MIFAAASGFLIPGSWITIWFEPCLRISGSATPSLSTRFRMICTERSRSSLESAFPFGGDRLEGDLEASLEVEPERRALVERRPGYGEEGDAHEGRHEQTDDDDGRTPVQGRSG